jgi:WD40 repeat protein
VFSSDGQLIITASKADGRVGSYTRNPSFRATAHLRLWDATTGDLLWTRERSRAPGSDSQSRPDDQPGDGEDEIEIAMFSPDDMYVAAGGEDDKIEIWQVKDSVSGSVLNNPVLVKTLTTDASVDGMTYSHSGDLLFAGTEDHADLEVFNVQGDPSG